MTTEADLHHSSVRQAQGKRFSFHNSAAVAVYHWRGARPWPLDLTADDRGWLLCLCLEREGALALLPVAWEENPPSPQASDPLPFASHPSSFYGDALDGEAYDLTLRDLQGDGWQVNGRLVLEFVGAETDANFWQTIHQSLWQSPLD